MVEQGGGAALGQLVAVVLQAADHAGRALQQEKATGALMSGVGSDGVEAYAYMRPCKEDGRGCSRSTEE